MNRAMGRLAAIAVFLIAQAGLAGAAEVKVFSTIGVQTALEELAPKFEQASGHKLNITWATAAILVKRVQAGETADLMVLTKQSLDALTKDGKAAEGPDAAFASSGMAVVVKKGALNTGHLNARRLQEDAARGQGNRLFGPGCRRRQRRVLRQDARSYGHRRPDEG